MMRIIERIVAAMEHEAPGVPCDCDYRLMAIAALKAMLMPTAVQLEAAWQESLKIAAECGGGVDKAQVMHVAERYYDAMIRAEAEG
jgi:hypothetical protein